MITSQTFGIEYSPDANVILFSSDGITRTELNTDIDAKLGIPCRVEYDTELGVLQLYAMINNLWTLKATQTTNLPKQMSNVFEKLTKNETKFTDQESKRLKTTLERTAEELNEERQYADKLKRIIDGLTDANGDGLIGDVE